MLDQGSHLAPADGEIMHVLGLLVFLVCPWALPHVTESLEMGAFFHRERRGVDLADQDAGFEKLHPFGHGDSGFYFPAADQGAGGDDALDYGVFTHHQGALRVNFSLKASINPDRAVETDHAFEVDTFPQKREILLFAEDVVFLIAGFPHEGLLVILTCAASSFPPVSEL